MQVIYDEIYMRPIFSGATDGSNNDHSVQFWLDKWGAGNEALIDVKPPDDRESWGDVNAPLESPVVAPSPVAPSPVAPSPTAPSPVAAPIAVPTSPVAAPIAAPTSPVAAPAASLFRLWLPQLRQLLRLFGRLLLLGRSVVPKPRVQSRLLGQATPLPVPKRVICVEMGRGSHFALM
jgi:hypothetical protein